jgi:DHA2 family multidrug resistance protein
MLSPATPHRTLITVCAMAATLIQALDGTIANVALPYMQGGLAATSDQITWVLTSYITASAILTAPVGWLAARYGRKRLFLVSVGGFTVASVLCGAAQSLEQIVLFRVLQGGFGAALVPLSQATMLDLYSERARGQAMAIWGMGVMLGPILGPTLGGILTDALSWRWVFYVNLPVGILCCIGLLLFMPPDDADGPARAGAFDWFGFAALGAGVGAFQFMLDRGEVKHWFGSTEIVAAAVVAALGLWLFLVHVLTAERPLFPPRLFADRNLLAGCGIMAASVGIMFASAALVAPYLQTLAGYSVLDAGLLLAPRGIGTMVAMLVAGQLAARADPRKLMGFGVILLIWSLYDMTLWTPDVDARWLLINTTVQGFALGFVFIPLTLISFATLPPALRTDGTAMLSLVRNLGSAACIAATASMQVHGTQKVHAGLVEHVTPLNRLFALPGVRDFWDPATPHGAAALNAEVTRQASIIAYSNNFHLLMLLAIVMLVLLPLMRRPRVAGAAAPVPAD